ncbi:MAG: hypothetical protein ABI778_04200, partial [Ignavibacteriota bacterium]
GNFFAVPRMTLADIIVGGVDQTLYAFFETKGKINLYVKDATFTAPADVHYLYFKTLSIVTSPTTTMIDIKDKFSDFVDSVLEFIPEN